MELLYRGCHIESRVFPLFCILVWQMSRWETSFGSCYMVALDSKFSNYCCKRKKERYTVKEDPYVILLKLLGLVANALILYFYCKMLIGDSYFEFDTKLIFHLVASMWTKVLNTGIESCTIFHWNGMMPILHIEIDSFKKKPADIHFFSMVSTVLLLDMHTCWYGLVQLVHTYR